MSARIRTYLDHNATTPMRPEAKAAVLSAMDAVGNASAQHGDGRASASFVNAAREAVALKMGVCAQDLYFTASGTEADNLAIHSAATCGCKRLLVSSMDHPATIEAAMHSGHSGAVAEMIPASSEGVTDMEWLADRLSDWDAADGRPFVSLVAANSECGVLQPVARAYELLQGVDGLLLVDAVQTLGKTDSPILADYVAVSAHKLGGPLGVGALYASSDVPLVPLIRGGGQERRKRAGTLNVPGIAGFGAAVDVAGDLAWTATLRDRLEAEMKTLEPDLVILGEGAARLPNTSLFGIPGVASQTLMMGLDLAGVSVSTGTACASGTVGLSRAVAAMGLADTLSDGVIRVSFGWDSTDADVDAFLRAWAHIRKVSKGLAA